MWNNIPSSLTSAPERKLAGDSIRKKNAHGIHCNKCNPEFHLRPDFPCRRNGGDNGGNNGGTPRTNSNSIYTFNYNYNSNSN